MSRNSLTNQKKWSIVVATKRTAQSATNTLRGSHPTTDYAVNGLNALYKMQKHLSCVNSSASLIRGQREWVGLLCC